MAVPAIEWSVSKDADLYTGGTPVIHMAGPAMPRFARGICCDTGAGRP